MKKLILIAVLVHACSTVTFAQQVYKDGSGRVILDLSVAAGMPAGAVDATPKTWVGTPSNASGPMVNNDPNGSINAKAYPKLEIAPYNMKNDGVIDAVITTGTSDMDWATAFNGCKSSTSLGGSWRLPTKRELMYMWLFKSAFNALLPTSLAGAAYWSATENLATYSWAVNFFNGFTNINSKSNYYRVRCVREL